MTENPRSYKLQEQNTSNLFQEETAFFGVTCWYVR